MLNKKDLRDLIETTLLDIKLTGAVVEKDYYAFGVRPDLLTFLIS